MKKPKILLLDIETAPGTAYVWNLWDDRVPLDRLITPGRMLSWGAKWYGRRGYMYSDERDGRKEMLSRIQKLMFEADAVVTYNGDKFDLPRLKGEMILAGLGPTPKIVSIDLYKIVRKLGLMSNRMDYFTTIAEIGRKVKHAGFGLWKGVMAGDEKSWRTMKRYNLGDIRLLEGAYTLLRPHIPTHPRLYALLDPDRPVCGVCGSNHIQFRGKGHSTPTRASPKRRFVCKVCGKWDSIIIRKADNGKA